MAEEYIGIRGAREHNLKNIDLDIPRDKLVVITGLSGSGKSSLAFDTIFAEGQRRYVESLSAYARQFLGMLEKPDVDHIDGLSPAISIDQKGASRNPRSTVGTVTEVYDYLRLLFARIGVPHCPECGREISQQTVQQMVDTLLDLPDGTRYMILAPIVQDRKGEYRQVFEDARQAGYVRVRVDGTVYDLDETPTLDRYKQHTIEIVVDRLVNRGGETDKTRVADSLETALRLGSSVVRIVIVDGAGRHSGASRNPVPDGQFAESGKTGPARHSRESGSPSGEVSTESHLIVGDGEGNEEKMDSRENGNDGEGGDPSDRHSGASRNPVPDGQFAESGKTGPARHSRTSGSPSGGDAAVSNLRVNASTGSEEKMDSRVRGNDGQESDDSRKPVELLFSEQFACVHCGISLGEVEPRTFSFNSPHGACPECTGIGTTMVFDPDLIVPNKRLSPMEGAILPWSRLTAKDSYLYQVVKAVAEHYNFSLRVPVAELAAEHVDILLYGIEERVPVTVKAARDEMRTFTVDFEGVIPNLQRRYKETDSDYMRGEIERFMTVQPCPACQGARLKPESLSVTINAHTIAQVTAFAVKDARAWFQALPLTERERLIGRQILKEIRARLHFLENVGLDYLTLDRATATLSGGEAQRIRLATQIGSGLVGVLYILDEPSIGLHQRDNRRLIETLSGLRDLGNTVLVVEHDEETIRSADHVIDIGPGAGEHGGRVVAAGPLEDVMAVDESLTAAYLTGRRVIPVPQERRGPATGSGQGPSTSSGRTDVGGSGQTAGGGGSGRVAAASSARAPARKSGKALAADSGHSPATGSGQGPSTSSGRTAAGGSGQTDVGESGRTVAAGSGPAGRARITVKGARANNLKRIDVDFPLGRLIGVTGVSGSGKSSLVIDVLYRRLAQEIYNSRERPGPHDAILGLENIDKVIDINQQPIGRTPRSNPATYTGAFTPMREIFAKTPEARVRGYKPGRFSFNVKGGRCEACRGDGIIKIEMQFLPDVYVPCEVCAGQRYNREALEITYKGKTIADVLDLTIDEANAFFENIPSIHNKLRTLVDVGLGYMRVGQPATTLSGGEAQRIKLASELSKRATGRTLYILDEPTTGLHFADVERLLEVLQRLVDTGNTVIVIEHNLEVIKCVDWVIDLGPEGGDAGGEMVAEGTPETLAHLPHSYTGVYLRAVLERDGALEKAHAS
ncbi:MAG: excinuclease ABC subunit UvrA [Chloroflexi bacterium]|nr:excinuclease ABC subunit UvrA [Chloroflexota bacterium]